MSDSGAEKHWGLVGEPPVEVEVTVLRAPGRPAACERVRSMTALRSVHRVLRRWAGAPTPALAVMLGAAVTASVIAALAIGGGGGRAIPQARAARQPGPAGVAAAYGYPLRCLSVTIALHDPRFARADFDRTLPCGRYAGYPTAIFHRSGGRWRPLLDATSYSCPVRWLPPRVQAELAVCP